MDVQYTDDNKTISSPFIIRTCKQSIISLVKTPAITFQAEFFPSTDFDFSYGVSKGRFVCNFQSELLIITCGPASILGVRAILLGEVNMSRNEVTTRDCGAWVPMLYSCNYVHPLL